MTGSRVAGALALVLALVACKDERPIRTAESRVTRRADSRDVIPQGGAGGGADAVADGATAVDVEVVELEVAQAEPERVTEDTCRAACQNALRLTLAELPDAASGTMRDEITRALEVECPGRCVRRGSLASVRCIAASRTALELAACPR